MGYYSKQKLIPLVFVSLCIYFMFSAMNCSPVVQEDASETVNRPRPTDLIASVKKLEEIKQYYIAWEEYRQILEKEPGNVEAQEGLERLKRIFPYGSPDPIKDAGIFTSQKITIGTYLLDTGEQISGIPVEETAEIIRVQGKNGEVALNKSMIIGIFQKEVDSSTVLSPDVRYKSKAGTISEDDADGHFLLSIFSMVNGLMEQANLEYQKATALDQRYSLLFHSVKSQYLFDMGMAKLHAGSASSAKQYFEACAQERRGTQLEAEALKKISECDERIALERFEKTKTIDLGGGVKMEFVLIRPGAFMMGTEKSLGDVEESDAQPVHKVTLTKPFYLGKYEVTQGQWQSVMRSNPYPFQGPNKPVYNVGRDDIQKFLTKLKERSPGNTFNIPTEAQWEYACRAGSTTEYCYGNDPGKLGEYAWYRGNSGWSSPKKLPGGSKTLPGGFVQSGVSLGLTPHPVGEKKPNAWGLYDMHGNVLEICRDWWEPYAGGEVADPIVKRTGWGHDNLVVQFIVLRGGSYENNAFKCRSAYRRLPDSFAIYGFRVSIDLP